MKMNFKKRLVKLETTVKGQAIKFDFIRIIVETDGTILGAIRRNGTGKYVPVFDEELAKIHV